MKTVVVSSPGKLLLFGDHAVVYGYPCIVTAVDQRMMVTITESEKDGVMYDVLGSDTRFLDAALHIAQSLWGNISHIAVQTKSQFSEKIGLGSSAAVTVSFLFVLSKYLSKPLKPIGLFNAAYKAVLDVQGVGSGVDVAASVYGGTIRYVMGGKEIMPIDGSVLPLVVGYTGIKADTATIVNDVKKKYEDNPEKVKRIFEAMGGLVDQVMPRLVDKDWERVGKFMDFNQEYLRDLGVSSEKLESLILAAKHAGALGAKLSGAGGGDCMIALVTNDTRKFVESAIEKAGGQIMHVKPNAKGVRVEV